MLTLAITTSTKLASISLFENDFMLGNININVRKTHSKGILEQVLKIFEWTNSDINNVENILLSVGPGSFTGVRIAMSLIKGMFSLDKNVKVYKVGELEALHYMMKNKADIVVAGIDSRKGKVYASIKFKNEKILADGVYNIQELVDFVNKYNENVIFVGDIYQNYNEIIKHENLIKYDFINCLIDSRVYYAMFINNLLEESKIEEIKPDYLEKSQAEKDYENVNN